MASAGPCASLHLAPGRSAPNHSFFSNQMPFLPPNQKCQCIEGIHILHNAKIFTALLNSFCTAYWPCETLTQNSITVVVHKLTFRQWFHKQQDDISISVDVEFHFLLCFGMLFRKLLKNDAASQATCNISHGLKYFLPYYSTINKIVHHPSHELWRAWCQTCTRRHVAMNYIHLQED